MTYLLASKNTKVSSKDKKMNNIRTFKLCRLRDISGISGTGDVAVGCVFQDTHEVVLHWLGSAGSINIYHSLEDLEKIHGHEGCTKIIFDDPEEDPKSSPRNN